eukprot:TRINITY_DN9_c0_g1_i1.p1 TRINITY_DN9_c0_g1~~TRINITY_DN9_c0_g1_i1.p1  ORF type:complete len:523 (+),score=152.70 TRINITY_DN9_c0_g1_i1:91-1569(+)
MADSRMLALAGLGNAVLLGLFLRERKRQKKEARPEPPVPDTRPPGRVPIFVMMPLDWMSDDGTALRDAATLKKQFQALKAAGVRGVMADVWWGLCEPQPGVYRFGAAKALCALLRECRLELQAVMSFHQCGGNVGDAVTIPIPSWALEPARSKGLLYKSKTGVVSEDCLSLSADKEQIFPGSSGTRTALRCYRDYIAAFASACSDFLGSTVHELQIGMGPCGELRYPSYMLSQGWNYPGVGVVMAYDAGMQKMLTAQTKLKAPPAGLPEDQNAGPDSAPLFKAKKAEDTDVEGFRTGDGKTFIEWYHKVLVEHGEAVLKEAAEALAQRPKVPDLVFSVKVSGIHWHYCHPSRGAETCAGYDSCSSPGADAYSNIAAMLARASKNAGRPVLFNFTCLEMNNWNCGMPESLSAPEDLIAQVRRACVAHNVQLAGENALEFDLATGGWAFEQMKKQLRGWSPGRERMAALTILRLGENFVKPESLRELREFVVST